MSAQLDKLKFLADCGMINNNFTINGEVIDDTLFFHITATIKTAPETVTVTQSLAFSLTPRRYFGSV
ncbi:hypothetical protein [Candidatus Magnetobacterium casense]|uniref:Uncharacterized protein n=1 Tax=Candidatus Magnetobacterium casense TaxID=1455061 RepID=A0ABS6RX11_9BACT|nr:hypothetical protein [Candidatus Magnetobacterium casensis]MBV6340972.1 hypothetical protein [Candidatus Magnetobacterium casensis]